MSNADILCRRELQELSQIKSCKMLRLECERTTNKTCRINRGIQFRMTWRGVLTLFLLFLTLVRTNPAHCGKMTDIKKVCQTSYGPPKYWKYAFFLFLGGPVSFSPLTFWLFWGYFHKANFLSRQGSRKAFWWKMTFKGFIRFFGKKLKS